MPSDPPVSGVVLTEITLDTTVELGYRLRPVEAYVR
jgi:hypothetical protein